jgi:hypothetical protein
LTITALSLSLSVNSTVTLLAILTICLLLLLLLLAAILGIVALLSTIVLLLLLILGNESRASEALWREGLCSRLKVGSTGPESPLTTDVHLLLGLACQVVVLGGRVILPRVLEVRHVVAVSVVARRLDNEFATKSGCVMAGSRMRGLWE